MAKHVLVKEPTGWHCLCCSTNFPLDWDPDKLPAQLESCRVNTLYEDARAQVKLLPVIKDLASWDEANQILRNNLEALINLDDEMSDGLQATNRRFGLENSLK